MDWPWSSSALASPDRQTFPVWIISSGANEILGVRNTRKQRRGACSTHQCSSREIRNTPEMLSNVRRSMKRRSVDGRGSDSSEIREWTRNVTSAREDRRLVRIAQTDRAAFSETTGSTVVNSYTCFIVCFINSETSTAALAARKDSLYTGFLSRKTIAACDYNGPMCIGAGVLIGSRSSFLTNPASICGTMMAELESGSMPVNGAFRSALSNATVDEHPELWSGVP
ncbi:hypothetical protein TNCV_2218241 [Trichonephila clavipes]|nr:hypothetical protein TNCV_2218241 [Trichonephila clavipes]